ncbi:MAG: hypothetical protein GY926_04890 [bacterium]|nr:hypothetical protein [bacterium]
MLTPLRIIVGFQADDLDQQLSEEGLDLAIDGPGETRADRVSGEFKSALPRRMEKLVPAHRYLAGGLMSY